MSADQVAALLAEVKAMREDVAEIKQDALPEIKAEVKRTNGRVTQLELWQARLEGARSAFSWVQPAIGGIVSGVVVGLILLAVGLLAA